MPTFDVDAEQITVFRVDDEYLFAHYFEREELFEALREYYDPDAYRFEIPEEEFADVREMLAEEYVELLVVEDLEPYCVVIEKYEKHAEILRQSVANWERSGHRFFLMKDQLSVEQAVSSGATRLDDADVELSV